MTEPSPWTDPVLHLDVLVMASATAFYSCLAIWAGLSRRHWFHRAAVLLASVALLYPIEGDEPMLMLLVALPAIALAAPLVKRRFHQAQFDASATALKKGMRFGLLDLFLATALIGCVVAMCLSVVRKELDIHWLDVLFTAGVTVVVALLALAAALARGRTKLLLWIALAIGLILGSWLLTRAFEWQTMHLAPVFDNTSNWLSSTFAEMLGDADFTFWETEFSILLESTLLITVAIAFARPAIAPSAYPTRSVRRWGRRALQGTGVLVAAGLGCLLAAVYALAVLTMPRPDDRFTEPNSYPRLVALGKEIDALNAIPLTLEQLQADAKNDADLARIEQLRAAYQEAYRLAEQPGFYPLAWKDSDIALTDFHAIRALARCLLAEAQSAGKAGRFDETIDNALACIQAADSSGRGGVLTHWLWANALENMGIWPLVEVHRQFSKEQAARVLKELQFIERGREPVSRVTARDVAWMQASDRWKYRLSDSILTLLGKPGISAGWTDSAMRQRDTTHRLLATELALHLFRDEHCRLPGKLDELVPMYIATVPIDPYSSEGKSFVYTLTPDGYRLYSVGLDGRDDGGRFGAWSDRFNQDRPVDIDLETLIRQ